MCVCAISACMRACVRSACVRACVRACVVGRVIVCVCVCVCTAEFERYAWKKSSKNMFVSFASSGFELVTSNSNRKLSYCNGNYNIAEETSFWFDNLSAIFARVV